MLRTALVVLAVVFSCQLSAAEQRNFVGLTTGYGHVTADDIDSSGGLITGLFARRDLPFGRRYKVVASTDLLFASFAPAEDTAGQNTVTTSIGSTANVRWPVARDLTLWGGAGFDLGYGWHRTRHTKSDGFLDQEFDDLSGFEYGLVVRAEMEYARSRDLSISITPQYTYALGTGVNAFLVQVGINL